MQVAAAAPLLPATSEQAQTFADGLLECAHEEIRAMFHAGAVEFRDTDGTVYPGRPVSPRAPPGSFATFMWLSHKHDNLPGGVRCCMITVLDGRTVQQLELRSRPSDDGEDGEFEPWKLHYAIGFGDGVKARMGEGHATHGVGAEFDFPSQPGDGEVDTYKFWTGERDEADVELRPSEQFDALLQRLCNMTTEEHARLVGDE